jgi:hypothetical protein
MKIGIITLWQSNISYGQLLQNYALQRYLSDKGHETYLIRYDSKNDNYKVGRFRKLFNIFNPLKCIKYLSGIRRVKQINKEEAKGKETFNDFRKKYINISDRIYYSHYELINNPPLADVYIAGSDTVWDFLNRNDIERIIPLCRAYFLDFGDPNTIRLSYAASINAVTVDKNILVTIKPFLEKFKYVTVREKESVNIFSSIGIENLEWVADPTLLLEAGIYRALYKQELIEKKKRKYCLLYKINISNNFSIPGLYSWAEKKDLDVIYIGEAQTDYYKKTNATVYEWLSLIDNAECVVTNSFHGTCFSVIFRKNFAVFPLTGEFKNANIRFNSLFEILGIDARFILKNDFSIFDKPLNWEIVDQKISDFQNNNVLLRL